MGTPEEAAVVHGRVEAFAQEFAGVIRRFLKLESWADTERIVVGGGFSGGRVGELAIGRTGVILHTEGVGIELKPIRHHPDEAGLLGGAQLAPSWIFEGHDSILAMDIGGTNARVGLVALNQKRAATCRGRGRRHRAVAAPRRQARARRGGGADRARCCRA